MIANLQYPFKAIRGALALGSGYYARMYRGKCIIQRRPTKQSARQHEMRVAFGAKYAGRRRGVGGV